MRDMDRGHGHGHVQVDMTVDRDMDRGHGHGTWDMDRALSCVSTDQGTTKGTAGPLRARQHVTTG